MNTDLSVELMGPILASKHMKAQHIIIIGNWNFLSFFQEWKITQCSFAVGKVQDVRPEAFHFPLFSPTSALLDESPSHKSVKCHRTQTFLSGW